MGQLGLTTDTYIGHRRGMVLYGNSGMVPSSCPAFGYNGLWVPSSGGRSEPILEQSASSKEREGCLISWRMAWAQSSHRVETGALAVSPHFGSFD